MKRNYRKASAYGQMVRLLVEAKSWGKVIGTFVLVYVVVVLVMSLDGCSTNAGTPGGQSGVEVGGNTADTKLGESDNASDTAAADTCKNPSGEQVPCDVWSDNVGQDTDSTITSCPPPKYPNNVVMIKVKDGFDCVPNNNYKNLLEPAQSDKWTWDDAWKYPGDGCDVKVVVDLLPDSFMPYGGGWKGLTEKPAIYAGNPTINYNCINTAGGKTWHYYGIESCNATECKMSAPLAKGREGDPDRKSWGTLSFDGNNTLKFVSYILDIGDINPTVWAFHLNLPSSK